MLTAVALAQHQIPLAFIEQHKLAERFMSRGGEGEYQFLWRDEARVLPVWTGDRHRGGTLKLVPWSCRRADSCWLPTAPATSLETVESGSWKPFKPRRVEIPATLILDWQVWVSVREGVHGLLVTDERGVDRVYAIVEPASHYYTVMTRSKWMPYLIGESI